MWLYIPIIWNDGDYDYAAVTTLMKFKLGHLRKHIAEHQHFVGCDEVAEEIGKAETLIDRYADEYPSKESDATWNELFDHLKANMRGWWC